MCKEGVRQLAEDLHKRGLGVLPAEGWRPVVDGFTQNPPRKRKEKEKGSELLERVPCPCCPDPVFAVKRVLDSQHYNLPDTAIYWGLKLDRPCLALGLVQRGENGKTKGRRPTNEIRERWQGLLWETFQVAFVDVEGDDVGEFCPTSRWRIGRSPVDFESLVSLCETRLVQARGDGEIPVYVNDKGSSPDTEPEIARILSPVLKRHGYPFLTPHKRFRGFWWGREVDLLFHDGDAKSLGIEVKVDEDQHLPLGQPLAVLLAFNGVINIRVRGANGTNSAVDESQARAHDAEKRLSKITRRAAFLHIE